MNYELYDNSQRTTDKVAIKREQRLLAGSAERSNFNVVNGQRMAVFVFVFVFVFAISTYSAISTNICVVTTRRNIVSG